MRVPISWLREYVTFEDDAKGLAARLTFSGTEVEGLRVVGADLAGMVVGEVRAVRRHPNADQLVLCDVFDGCDLLPVVCGAPNVQAGGKYPLAKLGCVLANGQKIKKVKLRGVESLGMLCAEDELGLSEDHAGLLALDAGLSAGTPLADVLGGPETVLVLEITPNRPDCLGVIGLAREVAALYGTALRRPEIRLAEQGAPAAERTRVDIADPDLCPRYTARVLDNAAIKPSPFWMQRRLSLAGVRPINNIVDITNYVMLECGQPLHAFDQTLLAEGRIVVRRAQPGETLATLDGVARQLAPEMLVIADAARAVAVAGVMGGAGSEIRADTRTILLESAYFHPASVRATSKKLGLATEASYRFERGADLGGAEWASRRAAAFMVDLAGAQCAPGVVDAFPAPRAPLRVRCRWQRLAALTGLTEPPATVKKVFTALELPVVAEDADSCTVAVPTFRPDIEREVDLIEEFARVHGLERIPAPAPRCVVAPDADDRGPRAVFRARAALAALGLQEIMNYSLVAEKLLDLCLPDSRAARVALPHPISHDQAILRPALFPQMIDTLGRNRARQAPEAALFEFGKVYFKKDDAAEELDSLAIGLMGPVGRGALDKRRPVGNEEMLLWLKGILAALFAKMNVRGWTLQPETGRPEFQAGAAWSVTTADGALGSLGLVRPELRAEWRLADPVAVAELRVDRLLRHAYDLPAVAVPNPYPCVERDIALLVAPGVSHDDIAGVLRAAAPPELEAVALFDVYRGAALGGRQSMAYALTFRAKNKTLTDDEVNRYFDNIKNALRAGLPVEIRDT